MAKLVNRAKMTTATTGTGTITLGSASSGFQTFASAGVANGDVINYVIEDGSAWEIGEGTYTSSGTTLSRTLTASSTGSLLNLSGSATVFVTAFAKDLWRFRYFSFSASGTYTPSSDVRAFIVILRGSTGGKATNGAGTGGYGYAEKYYSSGFAGNTYTVTIGAGGTTSGTSGGTTEFVLSGSGPSVTGGAGVTTATGGAGGVASGGDFNANGGSGGDNNGTTAFGGGGGSGGRAGNGGNGAAAVGSTGGGGGGTGGNNASGATGGAAATTFASGVYPFQELFGSKYSFNGGANASGSAGGNGANAIITTGDVIFTTNANPNAFGNGNINFNGRAGAAASAAGSAGFISIFEWWS